MHKMEKKKSRVVLRRYAQRKQNLSCARDQVWKHLPNDEKYKPANSQAETAVEKS